MKIINKVFGCAAVVASRTAEQRDELATLHLIELHSVAAAKSNCRISNWQWSVSRRASGYLC
jgi:hypothetical protein